MTISIATNKYDRAEAFLKTCDRYELEMTAEMFGVSLTHKKPTLVNAPKDKQQLINALIAREEARIAAERGVEFFTISQWGRDRYQGKSLQELRIEAKYKQVDLTYKAYRERTVTKTKQQLIDSILYETNYSDAW